MEKWAERFIENHKNPAVKLKLLNKKLFIPSNSEEEHQQVQSNINNYVNALSAMKVERKCARTIVKWLHAEKLGFTDKVIGTLVHSFGFQNKRGIFFYPEELLYLLESNRIELLWNNFPLSIEQAYGFILHADFTQSDYLAYRKCVMNGCKVVPKDVHNRKLEKNCEPPEKKIKSEESEADESSKDFFDVVRDDKFSDIFHKLQLSAPKPDHSVLEANYNYKIFVSSQENHEYSFSMFDGKEMDPKLGFRDLQSPAITCLSSCDGLPFYQIGSVRLPDLF